MLNCIVSAKAQTICLFRVLVRTFAYVHVCISRIFLIHEKRRKRKKNYKMVALIHGNEITDMPSVNLIFSWTIFLTVLTAVSHCVATFLSLNRDLKDNVQSLFKYISTAYSFQAVGNNCVARCYLLIPPACAQKTAFAERRFTWPRLKDR